MWWLRQRWRITWFILSQMGCQQAKRKFTFTLPWPQKLVTVMYHLVGSFYYMVIRPIFSLSRIVAVHVSHWCIMHELSFIREVNMLLSHCTVRVKSTARKRKRGQVTEVNLDIFGQRSLRAKPNYRQPCTSTQKVKQFGMTYIHCAQSLAKSIPQSLSVGFSRHTGRRGEKEWKRERER